jgi:sulfonate transport system ATP-binding protein
LRARSSPGPRCSSSTSLSPRSTPSPAPTCRTHLLDLWGELKPTLVVVTHDVDEAIVLGDRVVVMRPRPGRVLEQIVTDLPRPRDRQSAAFDFAKRRVLAALDRAQDRPRSVDDSEAKTAAGAALWW